MEDCSRVGYKRRDAEVVYLEATQDLGSCPERGAGSTPALGTSEEVHKSRARSKRFTNHRLLRARLFERTFAGRADDGTFWEYPRHDPVSICCNPRRRISLRCPPTARPDDLEV